MFDKEIVLKLLGRIAFTEDGIKRIVIFKKGSKSNNYVKGYNACDGNHSVTGIAKIIGITPGTLSPILKHWKEIGIIYEVERANGRFYKKLFPI